MKHALRPAADFKYPSKVEYSKSRSFQHAWLKEYPWLVYSPACDGGFCLSCILFSRNILSLGQLVNSPMVNFTRAKQTLREHSTQRFHQLSVEDTAVFTGQMERGYVSIGQQVQSHSARAIEKNRKVLLSMLKAIIFCGRQNIALRGRCSDGSDGNPGNLEALLRFRVDSGDTILTEHLSMATKNAQYRSPTIQNELISAVGEYIQQHILTEVREATCFSLCADEAVDAGNKEQLPFVLRFVDNENQIREEFIQFVLCDTGTTGEAIALKILGSLEKLALDPNKLQGQGYDGAGNMAGKYRGAAAVIQAKYPRAMYIHCAAHSLNLCVVAACSVPSIRNMQATLLDLCLFFNYSPKRQQQFEKDIKVAGHLFSRIRTNQTIMRFITDAGQCFTTCGARYVNVIPICQHTGEVVIFVVYSFLTSSFV